MYWLTLARQLQAGHPIELAREPPDLSEGESERLRQNLAHYYSRESSEARDEWPALDEDAAIYGLRLFDEVSRAYLSGSMREPDRVDRTGGGSIAPPRIGLLDVRWLSRSRRSARG